MKMKLPEMHRNPPACGRCGSDDVHFREMYGTKRRFTCHKCRYVFVENPERMATLREVVRALNLEVSDQWLAAARDKFDLLLGHHERNIFAKSLRELADTKGRPPVWYC